MTYEERALGCMIGSAYGDSLGGAVEFLSSEEIKREYGEHGIARLVPVYGRIGNITDDTQMAIATAEGIVGTPPSEMHNQETVVRNIWQQYRQWLHTQADPKQVRSPGNTCISALASGRIGTPAKPLNTSTGCGAIMRVHPVGIAFSDKERAFGLGVASSAITHGHPNGYIPAGLFSALTSELIDGNDFDQALYNVGKMALRLPRQQGEGTLEAVRRISFANEDEDTFRLIDQKVGGTGGWQSHDALAIGVFAVLRAADAPLEAVKIAVNHSGDSDSTGAIAGAIVGAMYGPEVFIDALKEQQATLEHTDRLGDLAIRLARIRTAE